METWTQKDEDNFAGKKAYIETSMSNCYSVIENLKYSARDYIYNRKKHEVDQQKKDINELVAYVSVLKKECSIFITLLAKFCRANNLQLAIEERIISVLKRAGAKTRSNAKRLEQLRGLDATNLAQTVAEYLLEKYNHARNMHKS